MMDFLKKSKFQQGDIAVIKKGFEEVTILKEVEPDDLRNKDLGRCYLIRGGDEKLKTRYEFELITQEEAEQSNPYRAQQVTL